MLELFYLAEINLSMDEWEQEKARGAGRKSVEAGFLKGPVGKATGIYTGVKRLERSERDLARAWSQERGLCREEEVRDLQQYKTDQTAPGQRST